LKKVFPFTAPKANYHCDAAILWCFDNRFELTVRNFLESIGVVHSDSIKVAGGAKSMASPDHDSSREFVLQQIRLSMRLHGTTRVMLMLHSDCGAYGGLAGGFSGDSMAEAAHHRQELQRAAANLTAAIPEIEVQTFFVDFEGVWATQAPAAKEGTSDSREQEPPPQFQTKASGSFR
jgi:carbonic anhydrase